MTTQDRVTVGFRVDIVVEPDDGEFHAYCPALKGLHVDGGTEEEALRNASEAALAYLESLIKHNEPIPLAVVRTDARSEAPPGGSTHSQTLEVRVA
ncbi:MAG: type II toxin-antitoxin system HicB family antitoxin [Dehalococcoidia bacterium]